MTTEQTNTAQLINTFRTKCRNEKRKFTRTEFLKAAAFGGLTKWYIYRILKALVLRGFVTQEGHTTSTLYEWKPLYKNENKLEEYGAINPNSWELVFKKTSELTRRAPRQKPNIKEVAVEATLTVVKAIDFLKKACPNIVIKERFVCADGSELYKEY